MTRSAASLTLVALAARLRKEGRSGAAAAEGAERGLQPLRRAGRRRRRPDVRLSRPAADRRAADGPPAIEVYRVVNAPPSLTTPRRRAGRAAAGGGTTTTVHLPGAAERRAATNVRVAEEHFYDGQEGRLAVAVRDRGATRGASVVYRDPLTALLARRASRSRSPTPSSRCGAAASAAPSPTSSR